MVVHLRDCEEYLETRIDRSDKVSSIESYYSSLALVGVQACTSKSCNTAFFSNFAWVISTSSILLIGTWRNSAMYSGPEALMREGPEALMRLPMLMEEVHERWEKSKTYPKLSNVLITGCFVATLF